MDKYGYQLFENGRKVFVGAVVEAGAEVVLGGRGSAKIPPVLITGRGSLSMGI